MMKKLFMILSLTMLCMGLMVTYGFADEVSEVQANSEVSDAQNNSIDILPVPDSTEFIQYWSNGIYKTGSNSVALKGNTTAYYIVDKHSITMRLEKWTGSGWVSYKSCSKTVYNTRNIDIAANYSVDSGYYYRITTIHTVTHGGITETKTKVSNSLLIN